MSEVLMRANNIELRDRMKDIVISGGENISSIEVEKALADHPAVAEVAIVAVPDQKWGEVPKAYVGLKPNHYATAEELIAWCRERIRCSRFPFADAMADRRVTGLIRVDCCRKAFSLAFCEKRGYVRIGVVDDYRGGVQRIFMQMRLRP